MRHWITLYAVSRETAQRQVFSRRFVRESIMRSLVFVVRRSLRQLVSANINLFARRQSENGTNIFVSSERARGVKYDVTCCGGFDLRNYNEKELNLIREVDCRKTVASLFWQRKRTDPVAIEKAMP